MLSFLREKAAVMFLYYILFMYNKSIILYKLYKRLNLRTGIYFRWRAIEEELKVNLWPAHAHATCIHSHIPHIQACAHAHPHKINSNSQN